MAEFLLVPGSFSEKEIAKTNTNVKSNMRFFYWNRIYAGFVPVCLYMY